MLGGSKCLVVTEDLCGEGVDSEESQRRSWSVSWEEKSLGELSKGSTPLMKMS